MADGSFHFEARHEPLQFIPPELAGEASRRVRRFGQVAVGPAERDMLQRLLCAGAISADYRAEAGHPSLAGANPAALLTLTRCGLAETQAPRGLQLKARYWLSVDGLEVAAQLACEKNP